MDQTSKLTCPQCLHQNSKDTTQCQLCDWPLSENNPNDTFEQTIAPSVTSSKADPNLTVAPEVLDKQKKDGITARTFNLAGDLAHFEIHEILGQGGMGAVYHAKDKTLQRDVAIKMLRPVIAQSQGSTAALMDEARMASKLNHPNIVTIYDVARTDDSNYIVMEWVDGQPLDELIPDNGLPVVKALEYACQIADGLTSAHQKYIIHRDIKPQNIMLSADGTLKILDFGIAGLVSQDDSEDFIEDADETPVKKVTVGTPSYMSPEQAQGLNLDQRSDLFSFGILLYQMLSGKRPFQGKDIKSIQKAICEGDYEPIQQYVPDLPVDLTKLLDKMLTTQKDERWQSSAELAKEMHRVYAELTYKKSWWERRHWLSKAAIIIPFVIGLGWSVKDVLFPASTQQLIERQLSEANKIAILPFENISGDPLIQLFGDGLAVNLGSDLAAIAAEQNNTWIVPATEISRMKDQSLKAVADKYGVNLVLTGSIQHMGSTRLLVLNLLNAETGQQVKTAEVSINADELFQGHGLIRTQALELLDWTVPKDLTKKFNAQRPQLDGAYREYVQGSGYLYRYDQVGNLDKALSAFRNATKLDEKYEEPYIGIAEVQLREFIKTENIEWLDAMTETINQLKSINLRNTEVNYLLAEIAIKRGDYEKAIELFKLSVEANPSHIKSHTGLAKALHKSGELKFAESIYKEMRMKYPNNWRVVSDLGIFYFQTGGYSNALKQFKLLSEISPNNDLGYRNMAAVYYSLGALESAIAHTELAIELRPTDKAFTNLGTMYFYLKKYNEAVIAYKKALKLKDSSYLNWGNLADAYKLIGDKESKKSYEEAVKNARIALEINFKDDAAKAAIAYYLANLGSDDEALIYAGQISQLNSGYDNYFVATAYDEMQNIEMTLKHLKFAIDGNYSLEEIVKSPLLNNVKKDVRFNKLVSQ